jgi:uncharacterized membrane protein
MIGDYYLLIKTAHVISSTVLFGTGLGTAFFMFWAHRTGDIHAKAYAARTTVLADFLFTMPAVIIQPLTGLMLIDILNYEYFEHWLMATYLLYLLVGDCWLPVVWIQMQLKKMAIEAVASGTELPPRYNKLFIIWFSLGWPAFIALVIVFFLMVYKPDF